MIKVVIDTNVVVSANLVEQGPSATILKLATSMKLPRRDLQMFASPPILAEYERVLRRPRLRFDPTRIAATLSLIRGASKVVFPSRRLRISDDESDNRFYECAEAAVADYLITGNVRHFSKDYKTTKIISPRDFLDRVVPLLSRARR